MGKFASNPADLFNSKRKKTFAAFRNVFDIVKVMGLFESPLIVHRRFLILCALLCWIAQSASETCEPRILEEVPPDPVRKILKMGL